MFTFPRAAQPLMGSLSIAFTKPTLKRFSALLVGAVLASGRRTLTEIQWAVFGLVPGHFSFFHRVFSRARWSLWPLGEDKVAGTFSASGTTFVRAPPGLPASAGGSDRKGVRIGQVRRSPSEPTTFLPSPRRESCGPAGESCTEWVLVERLCAPRRASQLPLGARIGGGF